jgi:hypothetical protein
VLNESNALNLGNATGDGCARKHSILNNLKASVDPRAFLHSMQVRPDRPRKAFRAAVRAA